MAQYRVLVKSFINNAIREEGDVVEYDSKPGENLELIEEEEAQPKASKKWKKGEAEPNQSAGAE